MVGKRFFHDAAAARCIGARDFVGAIEHYRRILQTAPNDPFALVMLTQCHTWNGDVSSAFDVAKKLAATDPKDFSSLRTLGGVFAKYGEHRTAKSYVERALALADESTRPGFVDKAALRFGDVVILVKSRLFRSRQLADRRRLDVQYDEDVHHWKRWAHDYLRWYDAEYGPESSASC